MRFLVGMQKEVRKTLGYLKSDLDILINLPLQRMSGFKREVNVDKYDPLWVIFITVCLVGGVSLANS